MLEQFNIAYLLPAIVGGVGVALVSGPFGVFMVWRRLAYFGDTLSHSGLLGITLALILNMNVTLGVCIIALLVASLLFGLKSRSRLASDTILGLLSYTLLALGLLLLGAFENVRVDILGFLVGDILTINWKDVLWIYAGGASVLIGLAFLWQPLLRITVHRELAIAEGVPVKSVEAIYLLLLAIVVAIAIKIAGVLLITALLIIPAAAARPFAKSPERMGIFASVIGAISVLVGIMISHVWDVPTGPAIVVSATGIFIINTALSSFSK